MEVLFSVAITSTWLFSIRRVCIRIFFYHPNKFSRHFTSIPIFVLRGRKRISLRLSPLALLTTISVAQSKIFLSPRSIDSRHLAPIRQVVICVEGIEIFIVAVRLPPGIAALKGTRLKRRGRIKEKKILIKKDEDWKADLYVLSLDERQPPIVERVGSTNRFVSVVGREEHRARALQ